MEERGGAGTSAGAFELKGATYALPSLRLLNADPAALREELRAKVEKAPGMLGDAPLVLDLSALRHDETSFLLSELIAVIREQGMVPVGVCNASPAQERAAVAAGLGVVQLRAGARNMPPGPSPPPAVPISAPAPAPAASVPAPPIAARPAEVRPRLATRVIEQAVRSGQKIYAQGTDLIVLGAVNPGAEVIADGHIHIYGPLRGRALAGAGGDESVRIFCREFEAELIAIAGIYQVFEDVDCAVRQRAVQIHLAGDHLKIMPL